MNKISFLIVFWSILQINQESRGKEVIRA